MARDGGLAGSGTLGRGVLTAQRLQQLRERGVERVGDPVERAHAGRDPAGLDLNDRLAVHAGCLGESVDGVPVGSPLPRDFNAEREQIWGGNKHASTMPQ